MKCLPFFVSIEYDKLHRFYHYSTFFGLLLKGPNPFEVAIVSSVCRDAHSTWVPPCHICMLVIEVLVSLKQSLVLHTSEGQNTKGLHFTLRYRTTMIDDDSILYNKNI